MWKKSLLSLFLLLGLTAIAHATDAYVSTTGGGASCTSVSPCATISAASSIVTAGGTIYIAPGTYQMANFSTSMAGTSGNVITVKCQAGPSATQYRGACVMTPAIGAGTTGTFWEIDGGGYVTVDGLQLDGRGQDGSTWRLALYASPNAAGPVTYQHNIVHHSYQVPSSACSSSGGAGIASDSFHSISAVVNIVDNLVHDIGSTNGCNTTHGIYFQTVGATIANNIVYNAAGWCIQGWHDESAGTVVGNTTASCQSGNITIGAGQWYKGAQCTDNTNGACATNGSTTTASNVLHFAASKTGLSTIQCPSGCSVTGPAWGWYDELNSNASANCGPLLVTGVNVAAGTVTLSGNVCATVSTADLIDFGPPSDNNKVDYNIAYDAPKGIDEFNATGPNSTYDRNVTFLNPTFAYFLQNSIVATNQVNSDPKFVDYLSKASIQNFHLQTGSPAIGAGAATNGVTPDFDGQTRPQGSSYDIGAYQYISPSSYFATGAGQAGTQSAGTLNQIILSGNANGLDNTGGMLDFHNPFNTGYDWFCRSNDSAGAWECANASGISMSRLQQNGSIEQGQYANCHGNSGCRCMGSAGLPAVAGSGVGQMCEYLFVGSTGTASQQITLTTDGLAAGAHNCANMPNNGSGRWTAQLTATDITSRGRDWDWAVPDSAPGTFYRDTGAASMTISSGTPLATTVRGTVTAIAAAITADTSNGCFKVQWTHPSSDSDTYQVLVRIAINEISP